MKILPDVPLQGQRRHQGNRVPPWSPEHIRVRFWSGRAAHFEYPLLGRRFVQLIGFIVLGVSCEYHRGRTLGPNQYNA